MALSTRFVNLILLASPKSEFYVIICHYSRFLYANLYCIIVPTVIQQLIHIPGMK